MQEEDRGVPRQRWRPFVFFGDERTRLMEDVSSETCFVCFVTILALRTVRMDAFVIGVRCRFQPQWNRSVLGATRHAKDHACDFWNAVQIVPEVPHSRAGCD